MSNLNYNYHKKMENTLKQPKAKGNLKNPVEDNLKSLKYVGRPNVKSDCILKKYKENDFEEKIGKMFDRQKFKISSEFNQKNSKIFLKDKDECMKAEVLDDTIPNNSNKNSKLSTIIKNSNIKNSFYSFGSSNYVKDIVDSLK